MATYTNKKKDGPKRWRGQVTIQGKVVASKWFSSAKADQKLAIAWEVEKKMELEESAKQLPIPLASAPQPKKTLTVLQWANAYLEECQRRNTVAAHVMRRLCKRAGVKAFGFHAIRHLAATILAQEGKSLFAIQHALRHEKQATTDPTCTVWVHSARFQTHSRRCRIGVRAT